MSYHREADALRAHIRSLLIALGCVTLLAVLLAAGWYSAPRDLRVHIPPDLRSAVEQGVNEVPAPNVFAFAHYLWTQIHTWPSNGADDYRANLYRFQTYLTPSCYDTLAREYEERARNGELTNRRRAMHLTPDSAYDEQRVAVTGDGAWTVLLDEEISESVSGVAVKAIVVRYPLRVVRIGVDFDKNPWGLAIACYAAAPTLLTEAAGSGRPGPQPPRRSGGRQ